MATGKVEEHKGRTAAKGTDPGAVKEGSFAAIELLMGHGLTAHAVR